MWRWLLTAGNGQERWRERGAGQLEGAKNLGLRFAGESWELCEVCQLLCTSFFFLNSLREIFGLYYIFVSRWKRLEDDPFWGRLDGHPTVLLNSWFGCQDAMVS